MEEPSRWGLVSSDCLHGHCSTCIVAGGSLVELVLAEAVLDALLAHLPVEVTCFMLHSKIRFLRREVEVKANHARMLEPNAARKTGKMRRMSQIPEMLRGTLPMRIDMR